MTRRIIQGLLLAGAVAAGLAAVLLPPRVGHPVTQWMTDAADAAAGRPLPPIPGFDPARPAVVLFILPGCPCSEEYEPLTQRLATHIGPRAQVIGVIAGTAEEAAAWQRRFRTPFPVVPDPDPSLARGMGAERSAYTALVLDGKTIHRLWPGFSAEMLREVADRLVGATDGEAGRFDATGAPDRLTSGCPLLDR